MKYKHELFTRRINISYPETWPIPVGSNIKHKYCVALRKTPNQVHEELLRILLYAALTCFILKVLHIFKFVVYSCIFIATMKESCPPSQLEYIISPFQEWMNHHYQLYPTGYFLSAQTFDEMSLNHHYQLYPTGYFLSAQTFDEMSLVC